MWVSDNDLTHVVTNHYNDGEWIGICLSQKSDLVRLVNQFFFSQI